MAGTLAAGETQKYPLNGGLTTAAIKPVIVEIASLSSSLLFQCLLFAMLSVFLNVVYELACFSEIDFIAYLTPNS